MSNQHPLSTRSGPFEHFTHQKSIVDLHSCTVVCPHAWHVILHVHPRLLCIWGGLSKGIGSLLQSQSPDQVVAENMSPVMLPWVTSSHSRWTRPHRCMAVSESAEMVLFEGGEVRHCVGHYEQILQSLTKLVIILILYGRFRCSTLAYCFSDSTQNKAGVACKTPRVNNLCHPCFMCYGQYPIQHKVYKFEAMF